MNNILFKAVIVGLLLLTPIWFTYFQLVNPKEKTEVPEEYRITSDVPIVTPPKVIWVTEPPLPQAPSGILQPIVVYPETFYTVRRVSEMSATGVRSIPKGVRVAVLNRQGDEIEIKHGELVLRTQASSVTSDLKTIELVTGSK